MLPEISWGKEEPENSGSGLPEQPELEPPCEIRHRSSLTLSLCACVAADRLLAPMALGSQRAAE